MNTNLKRYFILSLVLNILLIGVMMGHLMHQTPWAHGFKHPGTFKHHTPESKLIQWLETIALPEATREALQQQIKNTLPGAEHKRHIQQSQLHLLSLITTEVFDQEAFKAALAAHDQLMMQHKRSAQSQIIAIAAELNQDDRYALAQLLEQHRQHRPPH